MGKAVTVSEADAVVIDDAHPWPWLRAYTADARVYFNGREEDIEQVMRCLLAAPATVLFGRSGLGKTSLLDAGVAPRLTEAFMLPVPIRLVHDGSAGVSAQVIHELTQAMARHRMRWEREPSECGDSADPVAALWESLHDTKGSLRDAGNQRWTPVLIFDQFEEIFTRTGSAERQHASFVELGDLIEGRVPHGVRQRLAAHDDLLDRIDPAVQAYRVILSLREDYLVELERWADAIPRLGPNRFRLLPMSDAQALRAVEVTGGKLVDADIAKRIVTFLQLQDQRAATHQGGPALVEPALLSLVCASLNEDRLAQVPPGDKLDVSNLDDKGGHILDGFYDQAFTALDTASAQTARRWVQQELITADGTRRSYPMRALAARGIDVGVVDTLVRQRLLRIDRGEQGDHVELVHDRLAAVALEREIDDVRRASELAALAKEAEERARRIELAEQELDRRRGAWRLRTYMGAIVLVAMAFGLTVQVRSKRAALQSNVRLEALNTEVSKSLAAKEEARAQAASEAGHALAAERKASEAAALAQAEAASAATEEQAALRASGQAKKSALESAILRVTAESGEMVSGSREGGSVRGLLEAVAGYRITNGTQSVELRAAAMATLARVAKSTDRLDWIRNSGSPLRPGGLSTPDKPLFGLAVARDGSRIMTSSSDGRVRLWNASGEPVESNQLPANTLFAQAFSPDGTRLFVGTEGGDIFEWQIASDMHFRKLAHLGRMDLYALTISPDGRRLAANGVDGGIQVLDSKTGAPLSITSPSAIKDAARALVTGLAYSTDGLHVLTTDIAGHLRQWSGLTGAFESEFSFQQGTPGSVQAEGEAEDSILMGVAYSPDDKRAASSDGHGGVVIWDTAKQSPAMKTLQAHGGPVIQIAYSPDGKFLASTHEDGQVRVWDATTGELAIDPLVGHHFASTGVTFSADSAHLWTTGVDGTLRQWSVRPRSSTSLRISSGIPFAQELVFSPDGNRLVILGHEGSLHLYEITDSLRWVRKFESTVGTRLGWFDSDGRRLTLLHADSTPDVWDAEANIVDKGHPWKVGRSSHLVAVGRAGIALSESLQNSTLQLLDERTGVPMGTPYKVPSTPMGYALSDDGSRVAMHTPDEHVVFMEAKTGRHVRTLAVEDGVTTLAVSPNGDRVAFGTVGGALRVWWPMEDRSLEVMSSAEMNAVRTLAFDRTGRWLVSTSDNKTLQLWDATTGSPLGERLRGFGSQIASVAFSQDNRRLAAIDNNGTVIVWPILDAWPDMLCSKISANLSPQQWRAWISPDIPYVAQLCPGARAAASIQAKASGASPARPTPIADRP